MMFSRSSRLSPDSVPTRCDSASNMRSSSSECASPPCLKSTRSQRSTSVAVRSRNHSAGLTVTWKARTGSAVQSATCSVARIAYAFGTSSPIKMCRNVMKRKATAADKLWMIGSDVTPAAARSGVKTCAKAGSPIHPSPRLARVIPSWVADRKYCSRSWWPRTARARQSPAWTSSSMRVFRTRAIESSAAVKNPFRKTSPTATAIDKESGNIRRGTRAFRMVEDGPPPSKSRCEGLHDTGSDPGYTRLNDGAARAWRRTMMRGRMMSLTAVAIALALAGPARAMVEQHELDGDGLKKAAQENKALARYLRQNGNPDVAEMKPILDQPPWDDHEVTLYYFKSRKEISFARARVLGRPEVYSKRYERVMTDADIRALQGRPKLVASASSKDASSKDPSACTGSASSRAA